jgi:hypothetical protein
VPEALEEEPYALEDVRALVDASKAEPDRLEFWPGNSVEPVSLRLSYDYPEAEAYILRKLCDLTSADFRERSPTPPPPADIYNLSTLDGIHRPQATTWYVKFKIVAATPYQSSRLVICSFHPSKKP